MDNTVCYSLKWESDVRNKHVWNYIRTLLPLKTEAILLSETAACNTPQHRDISIEQHFGKEKRTGLTSYVPCIILQCVYKPTRCANSSSSSSSFYWASVANAPNVLQSYWLIVLPLDVPNLTASLLPWGPNGERWRCLWTFLFSNVPTFATSRLREILAAKGGTTWARKGQWILPENARLPRNIQASFTCRKSTTWDRRLYFPSEGRRAEDFFRPGKSNGFDLVWTFRLLTPFISQHCSYVPKVQFSLNKVTDPLTILKISE